MSEGRINWQINNHVITNVNIIGISHPADNRPAACSRIMGLFNGLSLQDDVPDCECSAILRIERGEMFRNSDYSTIGGKGLSEDYTFGQKNLFFCYSDTENSEVKPVLPILHLSVWDLSGDSDYCVLFPRYSAVMDSSIWNYFYTVPLIRQSESDPNLKECEIEHLKWIVSSIAKNTHFRVYDTMIAREYADLNSRITFNSYIANRDSLGHGSAVAPFLFHSEWRMKNKHSEWAIVNPDETQYNNNSSNSLRWRFLLVDDYANKPLKGVKTLDAEQTQSLPSKKDIIRRVIEDMGFQVCTIVFNDVQKHDFASLSNADCSKETIELWCVENLDEALALIKSYKFDIILLDYLLSNNSLLHRFKIKLDNLKRAQQINQQSIKDLPTPLSAQDKKIKRNLEDLNVSLNTREQKYQDLYNEISGQHREYGFLLLKVLNVILNDNGEEVDFGGPSGRQFFMFISAFTTAVNERLRAEGLNRSEKYWYIAEGACPTNTPELFKYYLARVMERRLEQTGIKELSEKRIMQTARDVYDDSKDKEKDKTGRISAVRKRAYDAYHDILLLHYKYSLLKRDQGKSQLVDSFLAKQVHMGAILEHLLQLVHLTAFGTVRQWPEIWEEYKFFVRTINIDKENIREFSKSIESYIIVLKSA